MEHEKSMCSETKRPSKETANFSNFQGNSTIRELLDYNVQSIVIPTGIAIDSANPKRTAKKLETETSMSSLNTKLRNDARYN